MKTTELVAWIGATTGLASLIWNIYIKATANRPKLVVKAYANMVQMPPPPGNPKFLRMTVQNIFTPKRPGYPSLPGGISSAS
jgi:hypothetical protein